MRKSDVADVAKFDSRRFGANRLRVLKSLYEDNPRSCFISEMRGNLCGYIMARKTRETRWVGPWISEDFDSAGDLLDVCVGALEEETELRLGMPAPNRDGISLVEKIGFKLTGKSVRMVLCKHQVLAQTDGVYGIGGPEKG